MQNGGQVGMATDHFRCHRTLILQVSSSGTSRSGACMPRLRHCVECPNCHTRDLIAFSPYRNGAYLVPSVDGCRDDYTRYCGCRNGAIVSRWEWREVKPCEVSKSGLRTRLRHDRRDPHHRSGAGGRVGLRRIAISVELAIAGEAKGFLMTADSENAPLWDFAAVLPSGRRISLK